MRRHALEAQPLGRGARIRDDLVGDRVGGALHRNLAAALVGIDFAAVADANRNARQRGAGQAEDVRVELGGVDQPDPLGAAPRAKSYSARAVRGLLKLVTGNSATDAATSATRGSHAPRAWRQATCTVQRDGSRRRTSSVIWRSVPPGSKLVMTMAIGSGAIDGHGPNLSKAVPVKCRKSGGNFRQRDCTATPTEVKVRTVEADYFGEIAAVSPRIADATGRTRRAATAAQHVVARAGEMLVDDAVGRTPARNSRAGGSRRQQRVGEQLAQVRRGTRCRAARRTPACDGRGCPRGSSVAATSLSTCFRRPFLIFSDAGSVAAKSITSLSSSGTRDSIECAMLMRSTFVRMSSGRYVSASKRIIWLGHGRCAKRSKCCASRVSGSGPAAPPHVRTEQRSASRRRRRSESHRGSGPRSSRPMWRRKFLPRTPCGSRAAAIAATRRSAGGL